MKICIKIIALFCILFLSLSCEKYLGEKTNLDFIEIPEFTNRQVAYVPIQPTLTQFERPVDIIIGFDEILYVVDEATEEVIALDVAGREIGRIKIQGARRVAQDRRFDLLVVGTFDTTVLAGGGDTTLPFSAIYRLRLLGQNGYGLDEAQIINKIVHPFYFKNTFSGSDLQVKFNGISVIGANQNPDRNNQYYVTRSGNASSIFNPDDAVLWFDNNDELISNVAVNTSSGLFNDYFEEPSGIVTLAQPPQITAGTGGDFIYTSLDPTNPLQVQYIDFQEDEFGAEFRPKILASSDTSKADGFINAPNKFEQPYDIALAGDGSRFLFVTDAAKDSLYQFTFTGFEGVQPPAATGITKFQNASFGGTGEGLTQFNEPRGVAYFNDIVYVADAGNGRVLRFKLTLDFD